MISKVAITQNCS